MIEQKEFLNLQIKEIEKYKWIESEKAGRDLGELACFDWVCRYAASFRDKIQRQYGQIV